MIDEESNKKSDSSRKNNNKILNSDEKFKHLSKDLELRLGYGIACDSDEDDSAKNDESKNHGSNNKKMFVKTNRGKNKG